MCPSFGRVRLRPLDEIDAPAWRRVHAHFRDPEISYLNGTPPNRMPLWLLKRVLRADTRRSDRLTFGVFDENQEYIGTIELYDIRGTRATLGIIIGEKSHWGKGYGPEAIIALLEHAFDVLGLDTVRLSTFDDNPRAQAAFRKVGFHEVRRVPAGGGRTDVQMELHKGSWYALHGDVRRNQRRRRTDTEKPPRDEIPEGLHDELDAATVRRRTTRKV